MSAKLIVGTFAMVGPSGPWRFHGKWIPFDCTMNPTNAAIAMRPCLISAWRNQPMDSLVWALSVMTSSGSAPSEGRREGRTSARARAVASQRAPKKPTAGLSFFARSCMPSLVEISPLVQGLGTASIFSSDMVGDPARGSGTGRE